jgi:hypothetical protein
MKNLTTMVAAAGAIALAVPVVSTDALAGSARHQAKKADRTVETIVALDWLIARNRVRSTWASPGGAPKDVSTRSSWGGS